MIVFSVIPESGNQIMIMNNHNNQNRTENRKLLKYYEMPQRIKNP